jgi:hypothetical protein
LTGVSFWKEINSRIPRINNALHLFFKNNDGSGSLVPPSKDDRNSITLFMQKQLPGKKTPVEFVQPGITRIDFKNNGAGLGVGVNKKQFILSWNDPISCSNTGSAVACSVNDSLKPLPPERKKSKMDAEREKPGTREKLKRSEQVRRSFDARSINLWSEARTNIRDINGLIFVGAAGAFGVATSAFAFLPALGLATLASPMAIGAPVLANGEAIVRNLKGEWFLDDQIDEDRWISEIDIDPSDVDSAFVKQDDEFYFHAGINFKRQLHCVVTEESDALSFYPTRRAKCS